MKRTGRVKPKRDPRRRDAPQWTANEWADGSVALWTRSRGLCERCNAPLPGGPAGPWERHHRQRRRVGGDRLANLVALCGGPQGCHALVHAQPAQAMSDGWIVSSYAGDPADVPIGSLLLDDDGGVRAA